MEKIFVADSYKDMEILGEPFKNEKGRLFVKIKGTCPRCGGSGHYSYNQVDGTRCYGCGGSGIAIKSVRAYTEKEYNRMQKNNERNRIKKENERIEKLHDLEENAVKYKHEVALKLGFGEDEQIYLVCGNNTFAIKDELKNAGGRFNPLFKWFFSKKVDLPEGYELCPISFDEVYDYNVQSKWATLKEEAEEIIKNKISNTIIIDNNSIFYPGKEKERIYDIDVTVENIYSFESAYGYTTTYTFTFENYTFVWMTSKVIDLNVGEKALLTGTIKKFEEYMGIKKTYLTRCIIKK